MSNPQIVRGRPLKSYNTPQNIISYAMNQFRSQRYSTIVVEGENDERFFRQWIGKNAKVRFAGYEGKDLVLGVFRESERQGFRDPKCLTFVVDVDFDAINSSIIMDERFVYNEFCYRQAAVCHNDLECFLICSPSLEKVLANYDIDISDSDEIRQKLEAATKIIGSYRIADVQIQKEFRKSNSILNGIEISEFVCMPSMQVDISKLNNSIPKWSNYRELVEPLIERATALTQTNPKPWTFSRGHDATELLSSYINATRNKHLRPEKLEQDLRLACEKEWFMHSPMGSRIIDTNKREILGM